MQGVTDGQVLVWHDLLGLYEGHAPRFVKQYANLAVAIEEAVGRFVEDVRGRRFPEEQHTYAMPEEELALFERVRPDLVLVGDSLGMVLQGHDTTVPVTMDDMEYHVRMVARGSAHALVLADLPSWSDLLQYAEPGSGLLTQELGHPPRRIPAEPAWLAWPAPVLKVATVVGPSTEGRSEMPKA